LFIGYCSFFRQLEIRLILFKYYFVIISSHKNKKMIENTLHLKYPLRLVVLAVKKRIAADPDKKHRDKLREWNKKTKTRFFLSWHYSP